VSDAASLPPTTRMRAEIVRRRTSGPYVTITVAADRIAGMAVPGQFVEVAVGGPATLLRRPLSIAGITRTANIGTIDLVFEPSGPGTAWLATLDVRDQIDVLGPLGTGFPLPRRAVPSLLVGGGYGAAPLYALADELVRGGMRVDMIIGASTADRLLSSIEAKRAASSVRMTTEDGSAGVRGRVTDVMDQAIEECGSAVVYACGPNAMLAAVSAVATARGVPVRVALEERMACGIGVCMTCVVPLRDRQGTVSMVRSCVEGPVLDGARVDWQGVLSSGVVAP
jgi:dihydroorotate dehydrogenase electron transfer subunit